MCREPADAMGMQCRLVLDMRKQGALLSEYLTPGQVTLFFKTLTVIVLTILSMLTAWVPGRLSSGWKPEHGFMVMANALGVGCLLQQVVFQVLRGAGSFTEVRGNG